MTAPSLPPVSGAAPSPAPTWDDPARQAAFERWFDGLCQHHSLLPATLRLASADASFRRYFRVDTRDGASRIIMDAPPAHENCAPFVKVAALMRDAGLRVPEVLDWNQADGFLLLSDLGRHTLLEALDPTRPQDALPFFDQATDALVAWQKASRPGVLPPYDRALLTRELSLFPEWYVQRHRGVAVEGALQESLARVFEQIVSTNLASPSVYVHRDFMPRNLMTGAAGQGLGVLDFQDAVHGPISYDIASLLRDAFISWDEEFVIDVSVRYWEKARRAGLPVDEDFGAFYRSIEWMGLQRHLKVAGIFARLTLRDGKPRYLEDAPRFIGYIRATAARYRELAPLLRALDQIENTQAVTGFSYGRL